jgi:hypothetical protein
MCKTLKDDRDLMLTDGFYDAVSHSEAEHNVVGPSGRVQKRKTTAILFPKLLNIVHWAAARIAQFGPTRLDLG